MTFAVVKLLWLLFVPAALLVWELTRRRKAAANTHPKILHAEAGTHSLRLAESTRPTAARRSPPRIWLCVGLAFAVFALARPQWGRLEEPVFDQSREILLALDLSRSMLTPDVKPSRLDRAKLLIQSLLEKLAGERVGLVVFSGTAFLQSPLSADYEILRELLPSLNPEFLPQGGSNYGELLGSALDAFSASASADRFLVILSDGEATDEEWKAKLPELTKKGIRVIGLGIGTSAGAMIPDGSGSFIKDDRGAVVLSKLESATLQELARATSGVFRDSSGWIDIAALVKETVETGRKGQFVENKSIRYVERFQWPLALALWCLLVSFYYEFPVRPRPRDIQLKTGPRVPEAGKAAALLAVFAGLSLAGLLYPISTYAAKLTPVTPPAPATGSAPAPSGAPLASAGGLPLPPAPPEPETPPLAKIIGRLSAAGTEPKARDWADIGRETVSWGSRLQSQQQPVPEGPVRDALAAVKLGSSLDPKTTDWAKLREELEALLKKNDDQQKQDQPQQQDQNQDQQNQEQKDQQQQDQKQQKKDQKKQDKKSKDQQKAGQPQDQKDGEQQEQSDEQKKAEEPKSQQGESAFGDMKDKQEPPPPQPEPSGMQKVGGPQEKKEPQPNADPTLVLPMQKLDQLRTQDSPAQLFRLMEGERQPTKKSGKDW